MTPKAKILGDYIVKNPGKVVLMTTRQIANTCGISEATVVRFAMGMGYAGYSDLQHSLRDLVGTGNLNTGFTLPDRPDQKDEKIIGTELERVEVNGQTDDQRHRIDMQEQRLNLLQRVVLEELNQLRFFYETINVKTMNEFIEHIIKSSVIYITGSRISYTSAYYMGWSLTKVRQGIHIFKGSDSTSIDALSAAPEGSLVVMVATARYPNELIKLSKLIKRLGHTLLVLTDSDVSPVIPFANISLVVPIKSTPLMEDISIPFTGNSSNMLFAIKYIVQKVAAGEGEQLKNHQQKVEQVYRENDIMFNLQL